VPSFPIPPVAKAKPLQNIRIPTTMVRGRAEMVIFSTHQKISMDCLAIAYPDGLPPPPTTVLRFSSSFFLLAFSHIYFSSCFGGWRQLRT